MKMDKKTNTILKIIAGSNHPIGSADIATRLKTLGIAMPERTVRYYLKMLGEEGLVKVFWKEGRMITSKGREELSDAFVSEKLGFMSSKIDSMAYAMDYDIYKNTGKVILNLSYFYKNDFKDAIAAMSVIFKNKLSTSEKVLVVEGGELLDGIEIPKDRIAFGTLCSINLNGTLLRHSIPVESKFGGLLQIEDERPVRFTEIINYSGSTLDPHEIFIKSKMCSVINAAHGSGKVLAGMREIPSAACNEAEAIIRKVESTGLGRVMTLGKPGQAICGVTVGAERVGIVVPGGLNPVAAAEESGIVTESKALVTLVDFNRLANFSDV